MKTFILFVLFSLPFAVTAQQDAIDIFVANQLKQQGIPGMSLGIIKNGRVIKAKGYGLANIELNVPVSEKTVFKIGSVSKQFVAVGIMKLVQDGKLKLTDPLSTFFKNVPENWNKITVRHLLNHTSGIPLDPPKWDGTKEVPDSVYIQAAFSDTLAFPTGSKLEYSNLGYFFLADIIRITAHLSFKEYMRTAIFHPGGLDVIRPTSLNEIIPNRAGGYIKNESGTLQNAANYAAVRASGAFVSDINDLLKWEMVMQNSELLTQKNWQQLWTDTLKTPLTMDNEAMYYGYGWMTNKVGRKQIVHHGGSMPGFRSIYLRYIEDKTAIIILTNAEHADAYGLAFGVAELLLKDTRKK